MWVLIQVSSDQVDEFIDVCLPLLNPGVTQTLFINLVVCIYRCPPNRPYPILMLCGCGLLPPTYNTRPINKAETERLKLKQTEKSDRDTETLRQMCKELELTAHPGAASSLRTARGPTGTTRTDCLSTAVSRGDSNDQFD